MDAEFLPPRPEPPRRQPGLLRGLWLLQRDALRAFPAAVYRQQMGSLRAFRRLFLIVNDPREIRDVFIARHATYEAKSRFMEQALRPVLGTSLFIGHGRDWAERREVVARLLHPSRTAGFHPAMAEAAAALRGAWAPGGVRDVAADLSEATTRIMLRAVFGEGARPGSASRIALLLSRYQDVVSPIDVGWLLGLPRVLTGVQGLRARATARALRRAIAEDLAAAGAGEGGLLPRLRTALREDGSPVLDAGALLDEVGMLLLAGSETSAATLAWALLLLANDPGRMARLRDELAPLAGRVPDAAEAAALPYTRAVLLETLRLYPPVPFLTRRALKPDRIRRWEFPAETLVMAAPWLIHRKPDLWAEPERFRPERFLEAGARAIPKHAFIPFGLGPRICAGAAFGMAEMTVILAALVPVFDLDPAPARGVEPVVRLTLRPKGGLRLGVRVRR